MISTPLLLADSDVGKGSPIGFFVVLVLVIAVYFLYRSLSRHIRGLPESFDAPAEGQPAESQPVAESSTSQPAIQAAADADDEPGSEPASEVAASKPAEARRPD